MVAAFSERRALVVRSLNAIPGIKCRMPKGAFYVFPNIGGALENIGAIDAYNALSPIMRTRTSPATMFQLFLLFRYGVATLDRKSFGVIGSDGKHYLRISIATAIDELEEAMVRVAGAATDRDGFRRFVANPEHLN
jgi:aspartate aminotransferase